MRRAVLIAMAAGLAVSLAGASAAAFAPPPAAQVEKFVEVPGVTEFSGRMILRPLQPSAWALRGVGEAEAANRRARALARVDALVVERFPEVDELVIRLPEGKSENQLAAELMATGDYQYVHPDWICYPSVLPDDPQVSSQWQNATISAPQAWDLWVGSGDVVLAFTDTGVQLDHPDLATNRVPGFNAVSDLAEVSGGSVSNINGHGTAVAGTAVAIGNNAVGVAGVGWNLRHMSIRVSDAAGGGAALSDILQGARWAVDNGARGISASYSGVNNASVQTTGEYVRNAGGLYFYAAGNSATDWSTFDYPDVVIVGASQQGDTLAGFSSFGIAVDLVAPGASVFTPVVGGWGGVSGTSFATPMANGVAGMIWTVNPALTSAQVEQILLDSCDDLGPVGEDTTFGRGRINVRRAVELAQATIGPRPPTAGPDRLGPILNTTNRVIDVMANDRDPNGQTVTLQTVPSTSTAGGTLQRVPGSPRERVRYIPPAGFSGTDTFTYTISDGAGGTAQGTVTVSVVDASSFRAPENPLFTFPGLDVRYYEGAWDLLPNFNALTPYAQTVLSDINFPSTNGNFITSGRADDVGAVFTGFVNVPADDFYEFFTNSDDGSRLFIGNQLVVNNDGLHGMLERSGTIGLRAGRHAFRVEFFERGGGAGLIVSFQGGGLSKRTIPAANLSRPRCTSDWDGNGEVEPTDIAAFFAAYRAGNADVDGNGETEPVDLTAFFNAYRSGC